MLETEDLLVILKKFVKEIRTKYDLQYKFNVIDGYLNDDLHTKISEMVIKDYEGNLGASSSPSYYSFEYNRLMITESITHIKNLLFCGNKKADFDAKKEHMIKLMNVIDVSIGDINKLEDQMRSLFTLYASDILKQKTPDTKAIIDHHKLIKHSWEITTKAFKDWMLIFNSWMNKMYPKDPDADEDAYSENINTNNTVETIEKNIAEIHFSDLGDSIMYTCNDLLKEAFINNCLFIHYKHRYISDEHYQFMAHKKELQRAFVLLESMKEEILKIITLNEKNIFIQQYKDIVSSLENKNDGIYEKLKIDIEHSEWWNNLRSTCEDIHEINAQKKVVPKKLNIDNYNEIMNFIQTDLIKILMETNLYNLLTGIIGIYTAYTEFTIKDAASLEKYGMYVVESKSALIKQVNEGINNMLIDDIEYYEGINNQRQSIDKIDLSIISKIESERSKILQHSIKQNTKQNTSTKLLKLIDISTSMSPWYIKYPVLFVDVFSTSEQYDTGLPNRVMDEVISQYMLLRVNMIPLLKVMLNFMRGIVDIKSLNNAILDNMANIQILVEYCMDETIFEILRDWETTTSDDKIEVETINGRLSDIEEDGSEEDGDYNTDESGNEELDDKEELVNNQTDSETIMETESTNSQSTIESIMDTQTPHIQSDTLTSGNGFYINNYAIFYIICSNYQHTSGSNEQIDEMLENMWIYEHNQ